jgi:hypothetical protein
VPGAAWQQMRGTASERRQGRRKSKFERGCECENPACKNPRSLARSGGGTRRATWRRVPAGRPATCGESPTRVLATSTWLIWLMALEALWPSGVPSVVGRTHADTRALPFARSPTAVANGAHALQFEPSSKQCTWLCSSGAVNEPGTAHAHPCWSASEPNLTLT